ncbi:hypothetical protein CH063_04707 [Colletotrichum higginsianum]|uniref:Uncharacterized protein n=1 Tax=Colletotrichum higginsianum (strain IMI 349063) TaxID=759273 RepID=H1UWE8_COLHI|nr:hypothetical protein CH63R_14465 [Colletotrichum higginsianum IMI 349063]OBR02164.1 hypothetical protein CH63R_14465 [Colletotrichum higginsianum IMI 349063]CCF32299.1 hypothetical protein CH063_04707 [Colletotrichum higginsianum]
MPRLTNITQQHAEELRLTRTSNRLQRDEIHNLLATITGRIRVRLSVTLARKDRAGPADLYFPTIIGLDLKTIAAIAHVTEWLKTSKSAAPCSHFKIWLSPGMRAVAAAVHLEINNSGVHVVRPEQETATDLYQYASRNMDHSDIETAMTVILADEKIVRRDDRMNTWWEQF